MQFKTVRNYKKNEINIKNLRNEEFKFQVDELNQIIISAQLSSQLLILLNTLVSKFVKFITY